MTPIDPVKQAAADPRSPMAPPYVDEDPDLALVEEGMDVAENETREAVADDYEASARLSDDVDEELDDIDFSAEDDTTYPPEVAAMHEDYPNADEKDEEEDLEVDEEDA